MDLKNKHRMKERPESTVTINTIDASLRGIDNGELVHVKTARGQVTMRALVTDDIVQGAIDANMGGGGPVGPEAWQKCNINELTDLQRYDPISGFPVYKALLCEVVKVSKTGRALKIDSGEYSTSDSKVESDKKSKHIESRIYLDHNATTPPDPEVCEIMLRYMKDDYGNPSSIYTEGKKAGFAVEAARRSVAQMLNCTARCIVFTGGGSEANNLALKGIAFAHRENKNHIITTTIEHPSVLAACSWLEKLGLHITYLKVDKTGRVHPEDLASAINEKTCLVSVMMANNETGSIQPIAELAHVARQHGLLFHTDATQAIGKIPVDVEVLDVDMLSMSAHKLYGPKGVGALYIRKGVFLEPLIHGGKQENELRAGTENVIGIAGLGKAAELAVQRLPGMGRIRKLRDKLEKGIRELIPEAKLNGHKKERLPNTLNMCLPGLRGESLVMTLDQKGVSISSGSACRSGSPKPSHALLAMGLSEEEAHCSIRLSLGRKNTAEEITRTLYLFGEVIRKASSTVRFIPCR